MKTNDKTDGHGSALVALATNPERAPMPSSWRTRLADWLEAMGERIAGDSEPLWPPIMSRRGGPDEAQRSTKEGAERACGSTPRG